VAEYRGLDSPLYGHFGSAPAFALVDSDTMSVGLVDNGDRAHDHGACSPLKALADAQPGAVVVAGIGAGALRGLRAAGIRVYLSAGGTAADAVRRLKAGELPEVREDSACGGRHGGHACSHG